MSADYAICLLAGGQARRMGGGDKGELMIGGQTIISRLLSQFQDAPYLFLNANGDLDRFRHYDCPVIPDILPDYQGPLSGIYAALDHVRQTHKDIKWVLTLPTDAPLIPASLPQDMFGAVTQGAEIVSVQSQGRNHPVIGLWSVDLFEALGTALHVENVRKIDKFTANYNCQYLNYEGEPDPFLNLNRPEDLAYFRDWQDGN